MRRSLAALVCGVTMAGTVTLVAQRRGGGGGAPIAPNIAYDGQFTFVRVRYGPPIPFQSQRVPWSHDYPAGERNLMRILNEISFLRPHIEATNVMALDDPELFKYPLAYLCEPRGWFVSDAEADNFRNYLQKGGFLVVDDFHFRGWDNVDAQIHRVLPAARIADLDASHAIFRSFFEIPSPHAIPQYYDPGSPIFRGIYEDNDPQKRLMVVIAYNTDISEFWEWSGTGFKPIDESNEAYKLGVNFFIYGVTH